MDKFLLRCLLITDLFNMLLVFQLKAIVEAELEIDLGPGYILEVVFDKPAVVVERVGIEVVEQLDKQAVAVDKQVADLDKRVDRRLAEFEVNPVTFVRPLDSSQQQEIASSLL